MHVYGMYVASYCMHTVYISIDIIGYATGLETDDVTHIMHVHNERQTCVTSWQQRRNIKFCVITSTRLFSTTP